MKAAARAGACPWSTGSWGPGEAIRTGSSLPQPPPPDAPEGFQRVNWGSAPFPPLTGRTSSAKADVRPRAAPGSQPRSPQPPPGARRLGVRRGPAAARPRPASSSPACGAAGRAGGRCAMEPVLFAWVSGHGVVRETGES